MSLRRRVLGYLVLVALATCVLTVVIGVVLVRHRLADARLTNLEAQADTVAVVGGAPGALRVGDHVYRVGRSRPVRLGPRRAAAVLAALPRPGDSQGELTADGHSVIYAARRTANGLIVLVRGTHLAFGEWRSFLFSLLLAGAGGILLAGVLSAVFARRLTRPIGRLVGATDRVARGAVGVDVPVDGDAELAELGRSFNAMSAELGRARENQRTFLESVSHELKTPLTSVRGYAEALEDGAVDPRDAGAVISAEANRLERLVNDLLDLARAGRSDFAVRRETVDLIAVVAAAVERHEPRARELGVRLAADPDGGSAPAEGREPARGLGDAERLLQAISNLVENALRLTPAGGEVRVGARGSEITVSDTGPGLAPDALPHAFERFYLHRRYRSERSVGTGLGLAIVRELVAAMGGEVAVENRPEGGTLFTVRLAFVDGSGTGPAPGPGAARSGASPSGTLPSGTLPSGVPQSKAVGREGSAA